MWENFKLRLGKIVQGVLNIFRKKQPSKETFTMDTKGFTDENGIILSPGTLTLMPTEKYKYVEQPITLYWEDGNETKIDQAEFDLYEDADEEQLYEELLKKLNAYKSLLPKRIEVPTLIVSAYPNWDCDSIGVDLSLFEEHGIAHFFCTSTKSMEEHMQDFRDRHPDVEEWEEEEECSSVIIKDAVLLEWEDGTWSWL